MPTPPGTEREAQALLIRRALRLYKRQAAVPNSTVYGWEADLLVTTRRGLVEEYEIKMSRSDWQAELKEMRRQAVPYTRKAWRAAKLSGSGSLGDRPNYFWLAAPPDVIAPDDVPSWAGYVVLHDVMAIHGAEVVKRAPRLHGDAMETRVRESIERGIALRLSDRLHDEVMHAHT